MILNNNINIYFGSVYFYSKSKLSKHGWNTLWPTCNSVWVEIINAEEGKGKVLVTITFFPPDRRSEIELPSLFAGKSLVTAISEQQSLSYLLPKFLLLNKASFSILK